MRPPAQAAAAAAILDEVLAGARPEAALSAWARGARYAGSSDREAVRDIVFDALRRRRSAAARGAGVAAAGGGPTGRALVLGLAREAGAEAAWFDGSPHALAPPGEGEAGREPDAEEALDLPGWLVAPLRAALGEDLAAVAGAMRRRAPVFLRVNLARISRGDALALLAGEGIAARPHPLAESALEVTGGARRLRGSGAYAGGLVELQDAASQAVVEALPLAPGQRVLDLCAGGGGKALAMAARMGGERAPLELWAHDAAPGRMADLPVRAARAGAAITPTDSPEAPAPFDGVLVDAPCSGSGSWRRDPAGKWALTPERLAELVTLQRAILGRAAALVAARGWLAYATCSLLREENEGQVAAFLAANPSWHEAGRLRLSPLKGGDGFFLAVLRRREP